MKVEAPEKIYLHNEFEWDDEMYDYRHVTWAEEKIDDNDICYQRENANFGYPLLDKVRELCDECDAVYDLLRKLYTKNGKGGKLLDSMFKKSNEIKKYFA